MSELITDAMVEMALEASYDPPKEPGYAFLNRDAYRDLWSHHMRAALEAAAPLIAAKALQATPKPIQLTITDPREERFVPVALPCRRCGYRN